MRRSALGCAVAVALVGSALSGTARSQTRVGPGIDLRILADGHVLARRGARAGAGGEPVRLVSGRTSCEGVLGPDVDTQIHDAEGDASTGLAADVRGCSVTSPLFAIVRPTPLAQQPVEIPASEPDAAPAIALAEQAAATAGHLRGELRWQRPRVYRMGGALYALVAGPACTDEEAETGCSPRVAALTRVRPGAAPELVLARPAHWLWQQEELVDCWFAWQGIVDVDGDGVVELIETQIGESAFMVRLVRVGARPAGDVVWLASYRDDPLDATVGRPPRPVVAH